MNNTNKIVKENELIPAIPPEDYKGTIADWCVALISRGYDCDGGKFYGDIYLTQKEWGEIVEECEK